MADTGATLTLVAGPNGSGKTTFARQTGLSSSVPYVDPDAVLAGLRRIAPGTSAIAAARATIDETLSGIGRRESLASGTTLAGQTWWRLLTRARRAGYRVRLVLIGTDDPAINYQRIAQRVADGGHAIVASDVERRYWRSLKNLPEALALVDEAVVYDNSAIWPPREELRVEVGLVIRQAERVTGWVATVIDGVARYRRRPTRNHPFEQER